MAELVARLDLGIRAAANLKQRLANQIKNDNIEHRTSKLSNQDKLYFPQDELRKGDLVDYYRRISDDC